MAAADKPEWEFHIQYTDEIPNLNEIHGLAWHSCCANQNDTLCYVWRALAGDNGNAPRVGSYPVVLQRLFYSNVKYNLIGAQCFGLD